MTEVGLALMRTVKTLGRRRVWLLLLWPAAVALLVWVGMALFLLEWLVASLVEVPPMTWLAGWGAVWLAKLGAVLAGWLLVLAAAFVTAMLLAASDYPELARLGKDSLSGAVWNSVSAVLLFAGGWLLTLPLSVIPGFALLLPILWMAWLTRRTFAYDALTVHATDGGCRLLRRQHSFPLLLLGTTLALLTHVPVFGLLTPTMAALAYVHYCLEALRGLRHGAVVTVIGELPTVKEAI